MSLYPMHTELDLRDVPAQTDLGHRRQGAPTSMHSCLVATSEQATVSQLPVLLPKDPKQDGDEQQTRGRTDGTEFLLGGKDRAGCCM